MQDLEKQQSLPPCHYVSGTWYWQHISIPYTSPTYLAPDRTNCWFRHEQPTWAFFHKQAGWNNKALVKRVTHFIGKEDKKHLKRPHYLHTLQHCTQTLLQRVGKCSVYSCSPHFLWATSHRERRRTLAYTSRKAAEYHRKRKTIDSVARRTLLQLKLVEDRKQFVDLATAVHLTWFAHVDW